jgi:nucleoside phosphorylase/tetratricopeptide (TPR) repeat protein
MIDKNIDVGIITIIPTEIESLFEIMNISEQNLVKINSPFLYYKSKIFSEQCGREISLVVSFINGDAGNVEASICTTHFLQNWHPKLMCMVGISAGIEGKVKIGDVVTPSKIIDRTKKVYKAGRYIPRTENYNRTRVIEQMLKRYKITLEDFFLECNKYILSDIKRAELVAKANGIDESVYSRELRLIDGSIASEDTLIRDSEFFVPITENVDEKCRGAEMEAVGFVKACRTEKEDFPWIIFRGISDMGDVKKSDDFQALAAKSASVALKLYLEKVINFDELENNPHYKDLNDSHDFNIYLQIEDSFKHQRWIEVCNISSVLSRYLWISGQLDLRIKLGNMVEKAAFEIKDFELRSKVLIDDLGWTTYCLGDVSNAKRYIEDGIRLAKEVCAYYVMAKGHRHLASIARQKGDISETEKKLAEAMQYANMIENINEKEEMLNGLLVSEGKLYYAKMDYANSIVKFTEALQVYQKVSDRNREVKLYALLGNAYRKNMMLNDAIKYYQDGLEMAYSIGRYDEISKNTKCLVECLDSAQNIKKQELIDRILSFISSKQLTYEYRKWLNYKY